MINHWKTGGLVRLSTLILAVALFAACSANIPDDVAPTESVSAETESQAEATSEDVKVISNISEIFDETSQNSETNSNNTEAIPADSEVDATGVPIGFTENGNPYRGNPNAPVVIEEFSDFQ